MSRRRQARTAAQTAPLLFAAALAVVSLAATVASPSVTASGASDAVTPSQWPSSGTVSLSLEGWPHAVRFAGGDRYETNLATTLGLRGKGDYPFDTPDRSSGSAAGLAEANDWWGAGTCPRSIIIVAGSSPADALGASALSDPTGKSSEPFLQRSAASDPLFNPVGGFSRVDTDSAPIIVTEASSTGVTRLSTTARLSAVDLRSGGCTLARQAIIVGGGAAVPLGVESDLLSIGYDEVFRIAGSSRFDTAARVAISLGTAPLPPGTSQCVDPVANDGTARMAFVVNAAVEYRVSATSCQLLGRTVVLAEGVNGVDALAAGWWTSFWQVPVLLHDGSATLPAPTVAALSTMNIDHIIVLGGTARISDVVAAEAATLASADVIRLAGTDRYETSIEMARKLGGWWPTGRADEFEASMVCLAASAGSGADSTGWPDALGAGPFCGALNGAASNPGMPTRALAPTPGQAPLLTTAAPLRPAHDAVPIVLVPTGATRLPPSVATFLAETFEPADSWCSSVAAPPGCAFPGFAIGFGGASVLTPGALEHASSLVSGGSSAPAPSPSPTLVDPFVTSLDMAPVFTVSGVGADRLCVARSGAFAARWLSVFSDGTAAVSIAAADLMTGQAYRHDGDGVVRSPGALAPTCSAYGPGILGSITARTVSLSGRVSPATAFSLLPGSRFSMLGALSAASPATSSGVASDLDTSLGGVTVRTYLLPAPALLVPVISKGVAAALTGGSLSLTLTRGANNADQFGPDTFVVAWTLATTAGTVTGEATGEATLSGGVWQLRGVSSFNGGTWNAATGSGGFSSTLTTGVAGTPTDDSISMILDGILTSA